MNRETWRCVICDCIWEETSSHCSKKSKFKKELCGKHYNQLYNKGKITDKTKPDKPIIRLCDICKSPNYVVKSRKGEYKGVLLCSKHNQQLHNQGRILERTHKDKNEIILYENRAEIALYNPLSNDIHSYAKIDTEDIDKISNYRWSYKEGYVWAESIKKHIHKIIVDYEIVDHKNRNGLDNRKNNLRPATRSTNGMNSKISTNNTSGVIGVSWVKASSKWQAHLKFEGKMITKSNFTDKEEAIKQRLQWEYEYFKEFAPQRHLFEKYGMAGDLK